MGLVSKSAYSRRDMDPATRSFGRGSQFSRSIVTSPPDGYSLPTVRLRSRHMEANTFHRAELSNAQAKHVIQNPP